MYEKLTKDDLIDEVQRLLGDRKLLLVARSGSELYGTQTQQSNIDLRVVFLPSQREILLGETDFTINANPEARRRGAGEIEIIAYSLMRWLDALGRCDMNAMEMLYASHDAHNHLMKTSVIDWVYNSRSSLIGTAKASLLKSVHANLGPLTPDSDDRSDIFKIVSQALVGADRSSCLIDHLDLLDDLRAHPGVDFYAKGFDFDVSGDAALEVILNTPRPARTSIFVGVGGRKVDLARPVSVLIDLCEGVIEKQRQKKTDRKCFSSAPKDKLYHALRVLDQIIELSADGFMTFPRGNAGTLRAIRDNTIGEEALAGQMNIYYQTAIEAELDLPFPTDRCLKTFEDIVGRSHLDQLETEKSEAL
jgi:hypothetical protein